MMLLLVVAGFGVLREEEVLHVVAEELLLGFLWNVIADAWVGNLLHSTLGEKTGHGGREEERGAELRELHFEMIGKVNFDGVVEFREGMSVEEMEVRSVVLTESFMSLVSSSRPLFSRRQAVWEAGVVSKQVFVQISSSMDRHGRSKPNRHPSTNESSISTESHHMFRHVCTSGVAHTGTNSTQPEQHIAALFGQVSTVDRTCCVGLKCRCLAPRTEINFLLWCRRLQYNECLSPSSVEAAFVSLISTRLYRELSVSKMPVPVVPMDESAVVVGSGRREPLEVPGLDDGTASESAGFPRASIVVDPFLKSS